MVLQAKVGLPIKLKTMGLFRCLHWARNGLANGTFWVPAWVFWEPAMGLFGASMGLLGAVMGLFGASVGLFLICFFMFCLITFWKVVS